MPCKIPIIWISQIIEWGDKCGVATLKVHLEAEILLSDIALERSQMLVYSLLALLEQSQTSKTLLF